jgi:hypothetical protein
MKEPVPEKGEVPPDPVTVTVAESPLHPILPDVFEAVSNVGCVIAILVVATHELLSVTVNVYVPAALVKVPVPETYGVVPPVPFTVTVVVPP